MNRPLKIKFEESSKSLVVRIDEFYSQIKSKSDLSKSKSRSKKDAHLLYENVKKICLKEKKILETLYPNKNTQHRYFTKYRNTAITHPIYHIDQQSPLYSLIMDIMKLGRTDSENRSLNRDMRIDLKTNNIALFEVRPFIKACQELLMQEDQDPYTLVIGLMGLTGRRPIEILKTGKFKYINSQYVLFSGQAKTRETEGTKSSYRIPVLADAKMIIAALRLVRQHFPVSSWENERVISFFTGKLIRRMKLLEHCVFPNQHINLNSRALRSLYATSAYQVFSMGTKVSFNAFIAKVLGHSHLDKNTANCYTYYGVCPKNDSESPFQPTYAGE
jgi:hypothetical protein